VGKRLIFAVVKADAYGHGSAAVSKVLLENGADALAVASLNEAAALRKAGVDCPILALSLTPDDCCEALVTHDVTPVTSSLENARVISAVAAGAGLTKDVFAAVDTGMGRIGVAPDAAGAAEIARIAALPNIRLAGAFAHFATSDERDKTYALRQAAVFDEFVERLRRLGLDPGVLTHANSGGVMELPSTLYDAVRPGIMLYGCYPSDEMDRAAFPLRPVMSVKARIIHIKTVPPGVSISYGRAFTTRRESVIGTLNLGYADGFPRILSDNKCRVIVRGQYAPIAGKICMDQCMIDLSDIPGAARGDEAVVMGVQGDLSVTAEELGKKSGAIAYEVLCAFGRRLPKVYKGRGAEGAEDQQND
jgi:alanine racemase